MGSTRTFNLADVFDEVVDAVPDREAVVVGALRVSYRQLAERVTWLASWMRVRRRQGRLPVGRECGPAHQSTGTKRLFAALDPQNVIQVATDKQR